MKDVVKHAYMEGKGRFHVLPFKFPDSVPLQIHLRDILDKTVDDRYFVSEQYLQGFVSFNSPNDVVDHIEHAGRVESMRGRDIAKRVYCTGG